jgi:hypothetical protein
LRVVVGKPVYDPRVVEARSVAVTVVAFFVLVAACATAASAVTWTHTKRQAELNILHSPRFFWRAGLHGFIRSRTRTFRTNVTVTCTGGRGPALRAHVFLCLVRYRDKTVKVRYTAISRYGFRLRIVHRTTR